MSKAEKVGEIRDRQRAAARKRRQRRWREIRCFWTWPFGHHHDENDRCANCGHTWPGGY